MNPKSQEIEEIFLKGTVNDGRSSVVKRPVKKRIPFVLVPTKNLFLIKTAFC